MIALEILNNNKEVIMKLIRLTKGVDNSLPVDYAALGIPTDPLYPFMATDSDGSVCAYRECPSKGSASWCSEGYGNDPWKWVAEVDLEGLDWEYTLQEITK
mgnify:CR=1 FL=1